MQGSQGTDGVAYGPEGSSQTECVALTRHQPGIRESRESRCFRSGGPGGGRRRGRGATAAEYSFQ